MASTPLAALPRATDIQLVDVDDPFMIEVLAPIESETKDAAIQGALAAVPGAIESLLDPVLDALALLTLRQSVLTLARDPTPTDIPAGTHRVVEDTRQSPSRVTTWANVGDRMVDLGSLSVSS